MTYKTCFAIFYDHLLWSVQNYLNETNQYIQWVNDLVSKTLLSSESYNIIVELYYEIHYNGVYNKMKLMLKG